MAHRLDAAGALVDVADPTTSKRVVATFEYQGSKETGTTAAGQHELWKPTFPVKKGHLYWIVGSVTMRWFEHGVAELVVWRSVANVELQKVRLGGSRDTSDMITSHSVFVNAMFVAEADGTEPLWVVVNTPADPKATGTFDMWLYDNPNDFGAARIQHHIYVIDMGVADALVPDNVAGHRLDAAGALTAVPAATPPLVADYASRQHVVGTAGNQTKIMGLTWNAKADHHYLVIALLPAVQRPNNDQTRDYWMYDASHGVNPIRTRIGTYGGTSRNAAQARPVALVAVVAGGGDVQIWGNRAAGDGDWLTLDGQHRMMIFDLGAKA